MEYTLVYGSLFQPFSRRERKSDHNINALINLALAEPHQYDYCYIRLASGLTGITVWTPELGYIGKRAQPA